MQQERRPRLVYWLDGRIRRQELSRAQDSKQISGRFRARRENGKYAALAGKKNIPRISGLRFSHRAITQAAPPAVVRHRSRPPTRHPAASWNFFRAFWTRTSSLALWGASRVCLTAIYTPTAGCEHDPPPSERLKKRFVSPN